MWSSLRYLSVFAVTKTDKKLLKDIKKKIKQEKAAEGRKVQ